MAVLLDSAGTNNFTPLCLLSYLKLLGSGQVLYKHVRGGWGSEGNVRDQNSYTPENGFQICEISLNSVVKGHLWENKSDKLELLDILDQGMEFCVKEAWIWYNTLRIFEQIAIKYYISII